MNFTELQKQAATYKKSPGRDTWNKLNLRLSQQTASGSTLLYKKFIPYAAAILLVLGSVGIFRYSAKQHSQPMPVFESAAYESDNQEMYSSEKINDLHLAYRKIQEASIN